MARLEKEKETCFQLGKSAGEKVVWPHQNEDRRGGPLRIVPLQSRVKRIHIVEDGLYGAPCARRDAPAAEGFNHGLGGGDQGTSELLKEQ